MIIETNVCIGGPLAGKRKAVELGRSKFEVVKREPLRLNDNPHPTLAPLPERIEYRKEIWRAGEKQYAIWVVGNLSGDDILMELLSKPKAFEGALVGYQEGSGK